MAHGLRTAAHIEKKLRPAYNYSEDSIVGLSMNHHPTHHTSHLLTLDQLQRIKEWHVAHRADHPLEYQLWDALLTFWIMGWVGWLPAFVFGVPWAYPLCLLAIWLPRLYVDWRVRAHRARRLRCDWLHCAR